MSLRLPFKYLTPFGIWPWECEIQLTLFMTTYCKDTIDLVSSGPDSIAPSDVRIDKIFYLKVIILKQAG